MKQITIVTEDRAGLLADVTELLAKANINIESFDSEKIGETAVINLEVDDHNAALKALAQTEFKAIAQDTILIKLEDKPGELARMAHRFEQAGVNLRSARLIRRQKGIGIVAISCRETDKAKELVKDLLL